MFMEIRFGGGRKIDVELKGHVHRTDQKPEYGGEGSAPEPVDLFFASIGACTASTLLGFCRSREIPTEGLRVTARMEMDEAGERVARIVHEVRLPDALPEKYEPAILRAAESCSVKRYLKDPPVVETVRVKE